MPSRTTALSIPSGRASVRTLMLACLAPVLFLAAVTYVAHWKEIEIRWVLHDPGSLGGLPFYAGFITKIGVVIWVVTASVSIFSYTLLDPWRRREEGARFLLASGTLSAMLGMDDFFTFHEAIAPRLFGISESVVLASYVLVAGGIVLRYRRFVIPAVDGLFLGAIVGFSASLVIDQFLERAQHIPTYYLLEDGFKFIGISLWAVFHVRLASALLRSPSGPPVPGASVQATPPRKG